jgi:hypothetical protein
LKVAAAFEPLFDIVLINVVLLSVLKLTGSVYEITRKSLTVNSQKYVVLHGMGIMTLFWLNMPSAIQ